MKSIKSQIKNPNFQGFNSDDASFSFYLFSSLVIHDDEWHIPKSLL